MAQGGGARLQWTVSPTYVPTDIRSPGAPVVIGNFAYFRKYQSRSVYKYDIGADSWSRLGGNNCPHPDGDETRCRYCKCPTRDNTLVSIGSDLCTVGGICIPQTEIQKKGIPAIPQEDLIREGNLYDREVCSNKIYVWTSQEKWEESELYPPMNYARKQVIAICHGDYLIVAGGRANNGPVKYVEVLNIGTRQWSRAGDLPRAVYRGSVCICNNYLYILGCFAINGNGEPGPIDFACKASLDELLWPYNLRQDYQDRTPDVFHPIRNLRHKRSACVSFRGHVLALGGSDQPGGVGDSMCVNHIYKYNTGEPGSWEAVADSMPIPLCYHFVAVIGSGDSSKLMVVGGCPIHPDAHCINMVQFGELATYT